jgi:hypothetical protein
MSMENRALDMLWRDRTASELLGEVPVAKTSGSYLITAVRSASNGWLYVGHGALVFIADQPIFDRGHGGTDDERILRVSYAKLGAPKITAPLIAPNAIVSFANGMEFTGQRRHMKVLHEMADTAR